MVCCPSQIFRKNSRQMVCCPSQILKKAPVRWFVAQDKYLKKLPSDGMLLLSKGPLKKLGIMGNFGIEGHPKIPIWLIYFPAYIGEKRAIPH